MSLAISFGMKRTFLGAALAAALVFSAPALRAVQPQPQAIDLTSQFMNAGVNVDGLRAVQVGGIVLLRGQTEDPALAKQAADVARNLGYVRVANLIRVVDAPDDVKIERMAERQLATRTLDGCTFHIDSDHGVVTVDGKVHNELQKDIALSILRNIDGVRAVHASLQR